jgi:predicted DNA-binding protein
MFSCQGKYLEAHHGEDVSDIFGRNGAVLVREAVEAPLEDVYLGSML